MKKSNAIGYIELSLAQFSIGINIILGKLLGSTYPICSLLALRFLIGFIIIAVYLQLSSSRTIYSEIKELSRYDWVLLFLQALCGGFLFNIFTLYGLQYTTATATGIVNSAVPALVAIFSFFLLKEALTKRKASAIVLTIIGILLLSLGNASSGSESAGLFGLFLVSLAIIPEALFTIFAKMIKKPLNSFTTAMFINLCNALMFFPLALNDEWILFSNASLMEWLQILLYGISGGILFFVFWYRGLAHTTANTAALFMGVMPVATSILAYLFLQETLSGFDVLGMLCVMISIFIGTSQRPFRNYLLKTT